MEREVHTARLLARRSFSGSPLDFHLEFEALDLDRFDFLPGQFLSILSERARPDGRIKQETRAYSLASPPNGNRFDLCLNRVPRTENGAGFFSNLLCDLPIGDTIAFHGPHGDFVLRQPLSDCLLLGHHTGIAPLRSMLLHLFAPDGEGRSCGKHFHLLHTTETESALLYREQFERMAGEFQNLHYLPMIEVGRPESKPEIVNGAASARLLAEIATLLAAQPAIQTAYICGLNAMVAPVRARLKELGWDRKQIVFERYD